MDTIWEKIIKVSEQDKNFKALAEKEKSSKENAEFEAQRKDAIAEASKQGSKKVFGGGNKQLLDHSVQKIVDQGFSIDQAEYALKVNRNNVDKALKSLQKTDNKHNTFKESRESREPRNKRFDKKPKKVNQVAEKSLFLIFLKINYLYNLNLRNQAIYPKIITLKIQKIIMKN